MLKPIFVPFYCLFLLLSTEPVFVNVEVCDFKSEVFCLKA